MSSFDPLRLLRHLGVAGRDLGAGRQDRPDRANELLGRDAVLCRNEDLVEARRSLPKKALRRRHVEDRQRQARRSSRAS